MQVTFLRNPNGFLGDEERRFAFETSAWQRCVQINVELTQVKRQSDQNLVTILNKVSILIEKICYTRFFLSLYSSQQPISP